MAEIEPARGKDEPLAVGSRVEEEALAVAVEET